MEKQKESKKEPTLKDKVDTIYEILSQHKIDIEYLGKRVEDDSYMLNKIRGRMGIQWEKEQTYLDTIGTKIKVLAIQYLELLKKLQKVKLRSVEDARRDEIY